VIDEEGSKYDNRVEQLIDVHLNDGIGRAGFSVEYVSVFIEKEESSVPVE
jgi:hypothetical protein